MGLPRVFGAPYNIDIVDAGSHYLMVCSEHNTPRRVWMDGRAAPADTPATPMGFSVGRWEGETLVIETDHLSPGWLDGSGLPMSGDLDLTEQAPCDPDSYYRDASGRLQEHFDR